VAAYSIRGHEDLNIEMTGRIRSNMDNLESNERENASAVLNLSNQATVSPSPSVRELPFAVRPVLRRSLRMGEWRSRKLRSLDKDFSGYKHDFCTNLWPLHRMGFVLECRASSAEFPAPNFFGMTRPLASLNLIWRSSRSIDVVPVFFRRLCLLASLIVFVCASPLPSPLSNAA
jgi:hypothetical protein